MKRRGWWLACALVLMTNLVVLLGVAWNRSGEPDAVVRLTERELPISRQRDEDTSTSLQIRFGHHLFSDWLDRSMLESLGFDVGLAPDDEGACMHNDKQLPRRGFVVLEHDGETWRRWLVTSQESLAESGLIVPDDPRMHSARTYWDHRLRKDRAANSRMFPVDAGRDAHELRRRYPQRDRYVILPAIFRVWLSSTTNSETGEYDAPSLNGQLSRLLIGRVHVRRDLTERLESVLRGQTPWLELVDSDEPSSPEPRYAVTLHVGRRYEPWIEKIAPIE